MRLSPPGRSPATITTIRSRAALKAPDDDDEERGETAPATTIIRRGNPRSRCRRSVAARSPKRRKPWRRRRPSLQQTFRKLRSTRKLSSSLNVVTSTCQLVLELVGHRSGEAVQTGKEGRLRDVHRVQGRHAAGVRLARVRTNCTSSSPCPDSQRESPRLSFPSGRRPGTVPDCAHARWGMQRGPPARRSSCGVGEVRTSNHLRCADRLSGVTSPILWSTCRRRSGAD